MLRRLVLATLTLALVASGARVITQAPDYQPDAAYTRELLAALESGDKATARDLMHRDPKGAQRVVGSIEDPVGKAARTAYDVRKQAAEEVIAETVKRVKNDPKTRGTLVSVEVGGTAGMEGPGFTPKTADLDFQFRGSNPEASRAARDKARQVMKDLGVPEEWGINPFAANPDPAPISATTADLSRNQTERAKTMQDRRPDPEASKGDASDAVRRDYYERGVAYEIDPKTGEIKKNPLTGEAQKKPVEDLYREKGWAPPEVTDTSAFGTAANERGKFTTLTEDAKRVFRAADALDLVDQTALTADERATVELSRRIYQTRDPQKALQSLPKDNPLRQAYDAAVKQGVKPADAAADIVASENGRARTILDRAVERTLEVKLAEVERTKTMSDHDVLAEVGDAAGKKDEAALDWLDEYNSKNAAEKAEMVKTAREHLLEQKRLGIVETFSTMDADVKTRLVNDPKFADNDLVKNASAFADVISGRSEGLNHAREALNNQVDRTARGADAGQPARGETAGTGTRGPGNDPPGSPPKPSDYHPDLPGGGALRAADSVLLGMALTGALDDVVSETLKAYDKGGKGAATIVFFQRVGAQAKDLGVGMAIGYLVEQAGLRIEAAIGVRGLTAGLTGAATIQAVVEAARIAGNTVWRAAQDPFLRTYLDPGAAVSFYQVMKTRPQTLYADALAYAKTHQVDPKNLNAVLTRMIKDYSGDSGVKATYTTGMDKRLLDALTGVTQASEDFLTAVNLARSRDRVTKMGEDLARIKKDLSDLDKAEEAKKAKADAAEAARKARERRTEKQEEAAEAKAAADKVVADKAAQEKAAKEQAAKQAAKEQATKEEAEAKPRSPSAAQDRLAQLRQQKQADEALQRQEEEDLRRQRDAEAAERRRLEEEAALLEDVQIDIGVPASLAPGEEGAISVYVRAPKGLRLSGRRVAIRASPGHTDDGSIPLSSAGRGQTVYVAPADYNGYVRVTANFEGYGQVSRTFLVGKAVAEAPPEQKIENPKPVTLPETPDSSKEPTAWAYEIRFTEPSNNLWKASGRLEVRGGKVSGQVTIREQGTTNGVAIDNNGRWDLNGTLEGQVIKGAITTSGTATMVESKDGAEIDRATMTEVGKGTFEITLKPDQTLEWGFEGTNSVTMTRGGQSGTRAGGGKIGPKPGTWTKVPLQQ